MQTEYDFSNAQRATQISHLNRLREQQHLLDKDVSDWLVNQDDDTKKWVNDDTYTEVFVNYAIK